MDEIEDRKEREEFERQLKAAGAGGRWFSNTPWWLVSAGIHAVVLLAAALVYVERLMAVEPAETVFYGPRPPKVEVDVPKTPDPSADHRGIAQDEEGPASNEPSVWDPFAKADVKNRSADDEPWDSRKGQSFEFFGSTPGEAGGIGRQNSKIPGRDAPIGTGPSAGGGGAFGNRRGGYLNTVVKHRKTNPGPTPEDAVRAALFWLARHQSGDGSWGAEAFAANCSGTKCGGPGERDHDVGVTGLSMLAFLGAGYSHLSRDAEPDPVDPARTVRFGEVIKKGLRWLLDRQDPEGCVGERGPKYMYSHAIAALALSEAYGMSAAANLREPAQRAIDFLVAAQNSGKGWRYSARCGDNDTSVTGWAVMALKSAELSDLKVPRTAYDGALRWFAEASDASGYYESGYTQPRQGIVVIPGVNESFAGHPSMSAVAVMSRIFINKKKDPTLAASNLLVADLPEWKANKIDFYYWYYGSLALFQFDGPDGPAWKRWNEPMKNAIVPHQRSGRDGCRDGSWDPDVERWGREGGRVYATAINALTLEVYYRYANVFGTSKK